MSDRLQEIRVRLDAASHGPWCVHPGDTVEVRRADYVGFVVARANHNEDADLIANAPADIAWLLAELDVARVRNERLAKRLAEQVPWEDAR